MLPYLILPYLGATWMYIYSDPKLMLSVSSKNTKMHIHGDGKLFAVFVVV